MKIRQNQREARKKSLIKKLKKSKLSLKKMKMVKMLTRTI